ncbi:MAG: cytochrome-c oxidase, cbb3-type subunit III, partial [Psychrobacter glacincola]
IWLYGGERETVRNTLRYGRAGVMPEWETKLGNERIMLLAAYIYSLSDKPAKATKVLPVNTTAPKAAAPAAVTAS